MKVDPNFNIESALVEAGIPLEVFEPYKRRQGYIARAKFLKHDIDKGWLAENKNAEKIYPNIAHLAELHMLWVAQERERNSRKKEF